MMAGQPDSLSASRLKTDILGLRFVLMYVLAIVLMVFAGNLAQGILANNQSDKAEAMMEYWSGFRFTLLPIPDVVQREEERLKKAIAMSPDNPIQHDRLSQLYLWELAIQQPGTAMPQQLHDQGLAETRKAIALLPGWASSWVRLVVWKSAANELDAEFDAALERVGTLGTWQALINHTVLTAALPHWEELSTVGRGLVLEAGKRALIQSPTTTLPILEQYERLGDVCQILSADDPSKVKYCENSR